MNKGVAKLKARSHSARPEIHRASALLLSVGYWNNGKCGFCLLEARVAPTLQKSRIRCRFKCIWKRAAEAVGRGLALKISNVCVENNTKMYLQCDLGSFCVFIKCSQYCNRTLFTAWRYVRFTHWELVFTLVVLQNYCSLSQLPLTVYSKFGSGSASWDNEEIIVRCVSWMHWNSCRSIDITIRIKPCSQYSCRSLSAEFITKLAFILSCIDLCPCWIYKAGGRILRSKSRSGLEGVAA